MTPSAGAKVAATPTDLSGRSAESNGSSSQSTGILSADRERSFTLASAANGSFQSSGMSGKSMYLSMREKSKAFYAGVELNNGWFLSFTSPELEAQYHEEVDTRRNPYYIVRASIIAIVGCILAAGMEFTDMIRFDALPPVKFVVGVYTVGLIGSLVAPMIASRGYYHNETLVIAWACFMVVINVLSSPFRAAWGHWGWPEFAGDDDKFEYVLKPEDDGATECDEIIPTLKERMYTDYQEMTDSVLIQINLVMIVGLNLFFDVRTSRSWVLPAFTVIFYACASLWGNLESGTNWGPEGPTYGSLNTLMMIVISYVAWQGRYSIEYAERVKWAEARKLNWDINEKEMQLKKEQEKILEMQTQMDQLEQTLASMEKLERSTLRRSTTVKGTNERRHLCVDAPPKCVVDEVELQREKNTMFPNALLVLSMRGLAADYVKIGQMAEMIRHESYTLRQYKDDCIAAFPELRLFFAAPEAVATGGRTAETEYQRTMGALFAVYWLVRLGADGEDGFCNGVDESWNTVKSNTLPTGEEAPLNFFTMTDAEKRTAFRKTMKWAEFANLIDTAGCGKIDTGRDDFKEQQSKKMRTMGMLALTAFHDIMKVEDLLPTVHEDHAPYMGYEAGTVIRDHDIALSYVLVHYPDLLPSFTGLHPDAQRAVLFTQSKLGFNHGWFVQAEAPPGAMLTTFKNMLANGAASPADVAFYFMHWLTDLAGAEATPKGGAEKFVLRFPHAVLASFLWSIPYLGKLVYMTETEVVEDYLKARWKMSTPDRELPSGSSAVALLRLAAMTQGGKSTAKAFRLLKKDDQALLALEMSRTGCAGQRYSTDSNAGEMGPAILVYYGPALLQRYMNDDDKMSVAVASLCEIYKAGRKLWPARAEDAGKTVTLEISQVKATKIEDLSLPGETREVWAAVLKNATEAAVELLPAPAVNDLNDSSTSYHILNFDDVGKAARNEKKKKKSRGTVTMKSPAAESKASEPPSKPPAPTGDASAGAGGPANGGSADGSPLPRPSGISDAADTSIPPPPQAR